MVTVHTECLGHITRDFYSINQALKQFFFMAELVSVTGETRRGFSYYQESIEKSIEWKNQKQLLLEPTNEPSKKSRKYSSALS
jgi:hypothetical protein